MFIPCVFSTKFFFCKICWNISTMHAIILQTIYWPFCCLFMRSFYRILFFFDIACVSVFFVSFYTLWNMNHIICKNKLKAIRCDMVINIIRHSKLYACGIWFHAANMIWEWVKKKKKKIWKNPSHQYSKQMIKILWNSNEPTTFIRTQLNKIVKEIDSPKSKF